MLTKNICAEFGSANINVMGSDLVILQHRKLHHYERSNQTVLVPFDQFIVAKTPAARWGEPEDLAGPTVFLASEASNFVNGHVLYVDGGILAYIRSNLNKTISSKDGDDCNRSHFYGTTPKKCRFLKVVWRLMG